MEKLLKMTFFGILILFQVSLSAQEDPEKAARLAKKYMQQAEEALEEKDPVSAEAYYRQAIDKDPSNAEARYNLGNLYYNKEILSGAVERHNQSAKVAEEKSLKHNSFHNQGNSFMKVKMYREAVEAYKNALRNNPDDEETRYNYALAKKLLEEEKKGGGEEDKDKKNQDQKQDQEKDDKEQEGDQGEKEQNEDGKPEEKDQGGEKDKKEGEEAKDDKGKPQDKDQQKDQRDKSEEEQPKQPQPRPGQLSPQQVKNLLEAMGNEEKKVQEKINAKKVKGTPAKSEKDW